MAKNQLNNINVSIFCALKVSEKSKVPTLLIANPGTGKSSTVELFAEVRGYKLILLRGNSESAETILGYDVAPTDTSKSNSTKHLRPEWFERILEADAKGEKCLLFLDEITTATEYVQAALLHLIFERKVGAESIPESTLIVSAGNYASNLSNSMIMLPPLMNRFMIYNIVPEPDDLEKFLCKYNGAIVGKKQNYFEEIKKTMEEIDKQELALDEDTMDKIGDYIERNIRMTAKQLMTGGYKMIDLKVTDLQNIYSDLADDSKLPGFVTLRTLNYLRDVTVAAYKCFGKPGITSDNYRNMVTGLVGLGVIRNSKGETENKDVTNEFYTAIASVVNEIEKMNNSKLPAYEKFFVQAIDGKAKLEVSDMNAIINKIKEMKNDRDIDNIERPIDSSLIGKMCEALKKSGRDVAAIKFNKSSKILNNQITVEQFNAIASNWTYIADMMTEIGRLVNDSKRGYKSDATDVIKQATEDLGKSGFKLRGIRKLIILEDPAMGNMIPEIKSFE